MVLEEIYAFCWVFEERNTAFATIHVNSQHSPRGPDNKAGSLIQGNRLCFLDHVDYFDCLRDSLQMRHFFPRNPSLELNLLQVPYLFAFFGRGAAK